MIECWAYDTYEERTKNIIWKSSKVTFKNDYIFFCYIYYLYSFSWFFCPLKKLIFIKKYKNIYIKNIDVVYGIFFLTFLFQSYSISCYLQKIFPLIIIFGLISFSYLIFQKKIKN